MRLLRRVVGAVRWFLTLAAVLGIAGAIGDAVRPRRLYGVTPWGSPTGLRITPLAGDELREALDRERAALPHANA